MPPRSRKAKEAVQVVADEDMMDIENATDMQPSDRITELASACLAGTAKNADVGRLYKARELFAKIEWIHPCPRPLVDLLHRCIRGRIFYRTQHHLFGQWQHTI